MYEDVEEAIEGLDSIGFKGGFVELGLGLNMWIPDEYKPVEVEGADAFLSEDGYGVGVEYFPEFTNDNFELFESAMKEGVDDIQQIIAEPAYAYLGCAQRGRHIVFGAILGKIEIWLTVIVDKNMTVDRRVAQIEHRAAMSLFEWSLWAVAYSNANPQGMIRFPPCGEVHNVFPIMTDHLRRPIIPFSPGIA